MNIHCGWLIIIITLYIPQKRASFKATERGYAKCLGITLIVKRAMLSAMVLGGVISSRMPSIRLRSITEEDEGWTGGRLGGVAGGGEGG